jgi:hypothetical protein
MPTSKPTNIDAQRILAIMDELKEKLTYLSVVTPQVLEGLQSEEGQAAGELLGNDLMKKIAEQIRLEELYIASNTTSDGSFALAEDNDDVRETIERLQKNTLELCRKMKVIPNIVPELRNFQETRPTNMLQFLRTLADMQELTLKRLTTTVEEERSRQELLEHYVGREEAASKRRQQLEKDLAHIRREREKAQSSRTEVLTKLKADLLDVKDSTELRMKQLRERAANRMTEHQEKFNAKEEEYTKGIATIKDANKNMRIASQEDEIGLRRQKVRRETDVENVIKSYDAAVMEMVVDFNCHVDEYKKEQKSLQELKEHFSKVDAEKERISHEDAITRTRMKKAEMERQKRQLSASTVQAFWRGIMQREEFVKMKKASRKKGGKKGGKKK